MDMQNLNQIHEYVLKLHNRNMCQGMYICRKDGQAYIDGHGENIIHNT